VLPYCVVNKDEYKTFCMLRGRSTTNITVCVSCRDEVATCRLLMCSIVGQFVDILNRAASANCICYGWTTTKTMFFDADAAEWSGCGLASLVCCLNLSTSFSIIISDSSSTIIDQLWNLGAHAHTCFRQSLSLNNEYLNIYMEMIINYLREYCNLRLWYCISTSQSINIC